MTGLGCNDVIGENFQKIDFFGVFALQIKIFCQNYFYRDSGFVGFNLMYHVTILLSEVEFGHFGHSDAKIW